jgi:hypothetical protein
LILVSTVWHSGTHSLVSMLGIPNEEMKWLHCCREAVELAESGQFERVITTYRDPVDVGISWCKRGEFRPDIWREQWTAYNQIVPHAVVYSVESLDRKLNSHPYEAETYPPVAEILFAIEKSRNVE